MNSVIRPGARDDIIRQFRWYLIEQDAPDAAFRFVDAVEESVQQLLVMRDVGAPREIRNPALKGLRVWPVKEFEEFLIFYVAVGETVRVIRVLHGRRDLDRILKKESGEFEALRSDDHSWDGLVRPGSVPYN
ncbi:MAG: type II toxin-antitoxin system RelE/ParE family toxin [Bryobacteraceae bacterium]